MRNVSRFVRWPIKDRSGLPIAVASSPVRHLAIRRVRDPVELRTWQQIREHVIWQALEEDGYKGAG